MGSTSKPLENRTTGGPKMGASPKAPRLTVVVIRDDAGGQGSRSAFSKCNRTVDKDGTTMRHKVCIISLPLALGEEKMEATADAESGRWKVTFSARPASAAGQELTVTSGDEPRQVPGDEPGGRRAL